MAVWPEDADVELGHGSASPPQLPREDRPAEVREGGAPDLVVGVVSSTQLKQNLQVSSLVIMTAFVLLFSLLSIPPVMEGRNPSLIVASASAFLTLIAGLGLMSLTMKQMTFPGGPQVRDSPYSGSRVLLNFSTIYLAFTAAEVVVSFLPKTYHYFPVVLMPTIAIACISFCNTGSMDDDTVHGCSDDPHKTDRKRSFNLMINMTSCSFMGALGTTVGYQKNYSSIADHIYVEVSIYFMVAATLAGLAALLLSRMLKSWKDWKKAAAANAIMLSLLVPAVLTIGTSFLGGVVVATSFPVAIAAAVWYFVEHHVTRGAYSEDELKPLYPIALAAMSVSFGTVMAILAGFLGGAAKVYSLQVCIFAMVSCFFSSASLAVVTFKTPKKPSLGEAAKALEKISLVLLVIAALTLVSYAAMRAPN